MPSIFSHIIFPASTTAHVFLGMFSHALGHFKLNTLYSSLHRLFTHLLDVLSCSRFQSPHIAHSIDRSYIPGCSLWSLAISIYLYSLLYRSLTHPLDVLSLPWQFQFIYLETPCFPHSIGRIYISWIPCLCQAQPIQPWIPCIPQSISRSHLLDVLDFQYRTYVWSLIWSPHVLGSKTKNYDLIYNIPFPSCFPGSAVHACSPYNSLFSNTHSYYDEHWLAMSVTRGANNNARHI